MSRGLAILLIIGALVVGGIGGVLSYTWLVGGSGEPSQPISAPTLSLNPDSSNPMGTDIAGLGASVNQLATQVKTLSDQIAANNVNEALATEVAQLNARLESASAPQEASPVIKVVTITPQPTAVPTAESTADPAPARTLFRISPDLSNVSFTLHEVLQGNPTTVVGQTDQVAGDIIVDFSNPANSEVGMIRINARTLTTPIELRNRAIRAQILQSSRDEYEFIDFTPTALQNLPASITIGEPVSFQIVGDLKIRDITKSVTFDATVTPVSETRLEGKATATVMRSDFDLQIPNVPGVANVTEDVLLEIDFVALMVER